MSTTLNKRRLSPKYSIVEGESMSSTDAISIVIQALIGGTSPDMRDELIVGSLQHLTGKKINYNRVERTFEVTSNGI